MEFLGFQCTWYSLTKYFICLQSLNNHSLIFISQENIRFKMFILQRKVCDNLFSLQILQVDHIYPLWAGNERALCVEKSKVPKYENQVLVNLRSVCKASIESTAFLFFNETSFLL